MKKLTEIKQLSQGTKFSVIEGDKVTNYEFVCMHPNNNKYIIVLEVLSQKVETLHIPYICGTSAFYPFPTTLVGEYESKDIAKYLIEHYKRKIEEWSVFLKD